MNKRRFLSVVIIMFSACITYGQMNELSARRLFNDVKSAQFISGKASVNTYGGSPYLEDGFTTGSVISVDSTIYRDIPLRYNVYKDQMEYEMEDNIFVVPDEGFCKRVIIGDQQFDYLPYITSGGNFSGFLEVMYDGNCSIYQQHRISLLSAEASNGYTQAKPERFAKGNPVIYIRLGNSAALQVSSKKSLISLFENNEKVQEFMKSEKINYKRVDDLVKLASFYSTL